MHASQLYLLLADAVLLVHVAVVLFIVGGLPLILIGNWRGWRWVNGKRLRLLHLGGIALVAIQAWLGQLCSLTLLESWLREQAGQAGYASGFVVHWVHHLLYYDAPLWVFTLAYSLFGLLVLAAWWRFPPCKPNG